MTCKVEHSPGRWRFILTPTRSANWHQIQRFFALIAGFSLAVATIFALQGFWPVIPFAGAELALLWFCFYHNAVKGLESDVIEIDEQRVAVEHSQRSRSQRWDLSRAWAKVSLEMAPARLHPSRLSLGSHGKYVHVGKFLTDEERIGVARELRNILTSH